MGTREVTTTDVDLRKGGDVRLLLDSQRHSLTTHGGLKFFAPVIIISIRDVCLHMRFT